MRAEKRSRAAPPCCRRPARSAAPSLALISATVKLEVIGGIGVLALWIWRVAHGWQREQRAREEANNPRSWRDDALMIVSAVLVAVVPLVVAFNGAPEGVSFATFLAMLALVYVLFHRAGAKRKPRYHSHENPPSAER